jgi:tetratricopeptide (TPR) repeat protein
MRDCQPIQITALLVGWALLVAPCVGHNATSSTDVSEISSARFASGLAMLSKNECKQATHHFQQALAGNPNSPENIILLGVAYDCSGDRENLRTTFGRVWNYDLDPQRPTAEITVINKALDAGLKLKPQTPLGKYFEALLYSRVGRYESALARLKGSPAPIADSWAYYNLLGTLYLRQSRFLEARNALETALARNNNQADTHYKLGTVFLATGDVSGATNELRQAVKLRSLFPAASAALGIALLQTGEFAAARDSLSKGTALGPEIYIYLGAASERLGDNKAAIASYRAALAQQPQLFVAEFSLGRLLLATGEAAEAVKHLQRATELDPEKAQAQLYLALALVKTGQRESAVAAAERAQSSVASENADFHDALGGVFHELGQQNEAQRCFKQAVSMDPAREDYYRHLAAAQRKAGDDAGAVATLQSGLVHLPGSARLHYLLGLTFMSRGSSAEALDALRKAAELEPENPDYQQSLGLCLEDLEKDDQAMTSFNRVLDLDAGRAAAYLQIGILQTKSGATAEGEQSFNAALRVDARYAPAYFRLGKIYYDRNDDAQALKFLEKAKELDPDWEDTYFLLGALYKRAGKLEQSAQMFTIFRRKKNELQDLRRKTYDMAPDAFEDAKPGSVSR